MMIRGGSDSQQEIGNADGESDEANDSEINENVELATKLRLQGKECHDEGDFKKAGELFQQAADALEQSGQKDHMDEYATCRLHQALCQLKEKRFDLCLEACTSILQDDDSTAPNSGDIQAVSPFIRARAYHRRAKAKLALEDRTGALQDARSAAFLGDSRGVALYGRLMREPTIQSDEQSIVQGSNAQNSSPNMAMFESLLQSNKSSPSSSLMTDFSPASLLMGSGGNNLAQALGSDGGSSLAQSVIKSLSKRLDDENTHSTISNYLKKTNKSQLQQLLAMAGMSDIQDSQIDRIVSICHGITPKTIKRVVKATKGAVYSIKLVRRIMQVVNKYKTVFVGLIILQWTKSALFRPTPIDKAAKKVTKQVLDAAVKAAK
eukprot:CAMPEP_0113634376 /NCGR_PEP_ID=MMETSP0017_2-20120614/17897_1 /TAXON_ID=2856 /ORGANISM="Cylindrotheca closterium" /LENGTH=377 /DNA_ID=CAMNT_0000545067 /DNA_START=247 /DNA_END=1380 /DNA_ORIENTATION=+ /assembly_acc=CAM_ASM_000147